MIDMGEHGWSKADFGPAKAVGRSQTRPVEALGHPCSHSSKVRMRSTYIFTFVSAIKNQFYYASICYNETYD